ncbi:DNA/RNA polymerases superfamily protein [Tanacetum coccineum]|uniref:DNA/RNA polymerases superfamily protein n=1 Tax=Tanacetum coccineum TaxID=301880 RepID=A0ABQ5HDN3_9ASTR
MSKVLQEMGYGSFLSSTNTKPRDHVKSITTTEEAETPSIRHIGPTRYAVSSQLEDDKMPLIELIRATIPFPSRLKEYGYDKKEVLKELKKLKVNSTESATSLRRLLREKSRIEEEIKAIMSEHCSAIPKDDLPPKENNLGSFTLPCSINSMRFEKALADLGASVSVMPYSTFTNLGLGKLAPTKLIIELVDKTAKRPRGITENVLVGIDIFVFLVDFIVLDMTEDIKIPLILERPFLSITHSIIDVFKRKFALRNRNDKIVFKSDSPTSNIIKKVYVLGLRERMELDLEARLMGKTLILNRSQDPDYKNFIELNDLNEPLEVKRNHGMEDLDPTIEEGEVIDELMVGVVKTRHDDKIIEKIDEYPSFATTIGRSILIVLIIYNFLA